LPRLDVVIAWVCVGFGFVAAAAIDVLFPLDGILLAEISACTQSAANPLETQTHNYGENVFKFARRVWGAALRTAIVGLICSK
jgi:hypothetical protein